MEKSTLKNADFSGIIKKTSLKKHQNQSFLLFLQEEKAIRLSVQNDSSVRANLPHLSIRNNLSIHYEYERKERKEI